MGPPRRPDRAEGPHRQELRPGDRDSGPHHLRHRPAGRCHQRDPAHQRQVVIPQVNFRLWSTYHAAFPTLRPTT